MFRRRRYFPLDDLRVLHSGLAAIIRFITALLTFRSAMFFPGMQIPMWRLLYFRITLRCSGIQINDSVSSRQSQFPHYRVRFPVQQGRLYVPNILSQSNSTSQQWAQKNRRGVQSHLPKCVQLLNWVKLCHRESPRGSPVVFPLHFTGHLSWIQGQGKLEFKQRIVIWGPGRGSYHYVPLYRPVSALNGIFTYLDLRWIPYHLLFWRSQEHFNCTGKCHE
jgi:hypothetical protein